MNNLVRISFFAAASLFTNSAQAQYGTGIPAQIKQVQERPLIVITETESPKQISALQKRKQPDLVVRYRQAIADYNADMRAVIKKFWQSPHSVQYLTYTEVERLFKAGDTTHSVLYCATVENFKEQGDPGGKVHEGLYWNQILKSAKTNVIRDHWEAYTVMQAKLIEEFNKSAPAYRQNLTDILPEKSDLIFGLQAMNHYTYAKFNRSAKSHDLKESVVVQESGLTSKTLLLKQAWIAAPLTVAEMKTVYPHQFEVVSAEVFNERVAQANPAYAYVQIVPQVVSSKSRIRIHYLHLITESATGKVLGLSTPGFSDDEGKMITRENLKDYGNSASK